MRDRELELKRQWERKNKMNLRTQFKMEDIYQERTQAIKTRSSATIKIIIGSIFLLFAGVLFIPSIMMLFDTSEAKMGR